MLAEAIIYSRQQIEAYRLAAMTNLNDLLTLLDSEYTDGYGPSPLPSKIDGEVESLVDAVIADGNAATLSGMNEVHGLVLLAYAERMASMAIRKNSVDILSKSMAAICIASQLSDYREAIMVLALVYCSAKKLSTDLPDLAPALHLHTSVFWKAVVDGFPQRPPGDRSIQAMGYVEGEDESGFLYHKTW